MPQRIKHLSISNMPSPIASLLTVCAYLLVCFVPSAAAELHYSTPKHTYISSTTQLAYHELSQAESQESVLLLAGGPGIGSWTIEPVQKTVFQSGYRSLLMDMRGTGENNKPFALPIIQQWIADLEALRQHKNIHQWTLVGHSWGALMALLYTQQYPEHVNKLILLNPVDPEMKAMRFVTEEIDRRMQSLSDSEWQQDSALANSEDASAKPKEKVAQKIIQNIPAYFYDLKQGSEFAKSFSINDLAIDININAWKAYQASPIDYREIKSWDKPIYFLGCKQDLLMPYNLFAMQKQLAFERYDLIEQCNHFPWVEQPALFNKLLNTYLKEKP